MKRTSSYLWLSGVCLLALAGALPAFGQDAAAPAAAVEPLRAVIEAVAPLYRPEGALWLRFTLINTSDEPVNIDLKHPWPEAEGVRLPLELALGTGDAGLLLVSFDDEAPKEIPPLSPPEEQANGSPSLKIAPHGSVGAEIDLRAYWSATRYPGSYQVEWRPLDGRLEPVTTSFKVESPKDAVLVTDYGKVTFVLNYDAAPRNVANFIELVSDGFYDRKTLHRIVSGFVIQGGCPKGDGTGMRPDGRLLPAEFHPIPVETGTLLMARKPSDPNSASCQFFIALTRLEQLDGQYTVIGQAPDEESQRTLHKLAAVPTDRRDRPLIPVRINSVNLIDVEPERTRHLEMHSSRRSTAKTPATQPPTDSKTD